MALSPNPEISVTEYLQELTALLESPSIASTIDHHPFTGFTVDKELFGDVLVELGLIMRVRLYLTQSISHSDYNLGALIRPNDHSL